MAACILPQTEDVITFDELYGRLFIAATMKCRTSKEAWKMLGISEATFYKWKKKYSTNGIFISRLKGNAGQCISREEQVSSKV